MIDLSSRNPGRALVAVQRYRFDDFKPYVYRTEDYGTTWDLLTDGENGIPENHFVRVVREDPESEGLLYAGTEFGIYVSFDDGAHWQSLQLNLPITPVTDLAFQGGNLIVATQGRSFWILDALNVLHEVKNADEEAPVLIQQATVYRASFSQASSRPGSREGSSPPNGAVIYYYLPEEPGEEEVKVEFMDRSEKVIRTFESSAEEDKEDSDSPFQSSDKKQAPAKAGLNQLVWNLRHPQIEKAEGAVVWGYTGGAEVVPGSYSVRLTVGDWTATKSFEVLKDPRIKTTQEELEEQFALMMEIRESIDQLYDTVREIRSIKEQLKGLGKCAKEAGYGDDLQKSAEQVSDKLTAIEEKLIQTRNESNQDPLNFPPMLDNQLIYVYGYVGGADARPTQGARKRFATLRGELDSHSKEFESVVENEVTAFEKGVQDKDLPRILPPKTEE
jgi:hypothetical protein